MQIRQRIFNRTDMQITHFILDKILKLLTYYVFLLVVAKLSDVKNSPVFFWLTLYILYIFMCVSFNVNESL